MHSIDSIFLHLSNQNITGVTSLTLKWASGQGHFCHIKGKDIKATLMKFPDLVSIGSSKTTKSFQHPVGRLLHMKLAKHDLDVLT